MDDEGYPDGGVEDQVELVELSEMPEAGWWLIQFEEFVTLVPAFTKITSAFTLKLESNVPSVRTVTVPLEAERESGCGNTLVEIFPFELLMVT